MRNVLLFFSACFIIAVFVWNVYCVQDLISESKYNEGFEQGFQ